jgi:hypothetical protein
MCVGCAFLLSNIVYRIEELEVTLSTNDGNVGRSKVLIGNGKVMKLIAKMTPNHWIRGILMDGTSKNPTD